MIQRVIVGMRDRKINVECLPTEDAISAYNYLVAEDRLVAATLIPPEEMVQVCKNLIFNRSSRRKRGMASNPLFIIPEFFLHFPNKLSYGYLRFEGNGKIPSNLR